MNVQEHITGDFVSQPYWWDLARPIEINAPSLPSRADVVIAGSGFTGLSAALTLARAGRSVIVLDSEDPGSGASRRNAGYLGRTLKKSFSSLVRTHGYDLAYAIYSELGIAMQMTRELIEKENINCYLNTCGRFVAAASPKHRVPLENELQLMREQLGFDFWMVSREDQYSELDSPLYHGGAVIPDTGSVHPGLYHKGLLQLALQAGVVVQGRTPVTEIRRSAAGKFRFVTPKGEIEATDAVIATNGYTPLEFHWQSRRVIPFTAYMAATEVLPQDVIKKAIPRGRTVIDTNTNLDYIRPAPDTSRLLFGGETGTGMSSLEEIAPTLRRILAKILPDLASVKLSHIWTGKCAGTFDMMPHVGQEGGIWYGMGYNFAGVPMGTYFGRKIAYGILSLTEGDTAFERTPFRTAPLYRGKPWFLPYAMKYFDWKDGKQR